MQQWEVERMMLRKQNDELNNKLILSSHQLFELKKSEHQFENFRMSMESVIFGGLGILVMANFFEMAKGTAIELNNL